MDKKVYGRFFRYLFIIILFSSLSALYSQKVDPPFIKFLNHPWVDSVFNSLSPEEKAAQLIWIYAYSNREIDHEVYLSDFIRDYGAGGIVFFQGTAAKQTEMLNYFQSISRVPLIIAEDGEWGLGMRLDGVVKFPYQMTLGAIKNDSLIYKAGEAIAGQFKRAGIHVNLAPVADINSNPGNPVINYRSFGEDPENVSRKTLMYMKGLQDNGVIAVAKHFPGHGDTETDSHFGLPVIRHSRERFDSVELVPFKSLINAGVTCIMPGHLNIPSLDTARGLPSSLSYPVLTQLLRNELSFKGLIVSDAFNMAAVTNYPAREGAGLLALKAGMDVLEYVEDPEKTLKEIVAGIKSGTISQQAIDEKCRRVLAVKYRAGLNHPQHVDKENLDEDLSPVTSKALIHELYANALTLLKNDNNIIPVKNLDKTRIATIAVNRKKTTIFQYRISKYQPADHFFIDPADQKAVGDLLARLSAYDIVIAGIYGTDQRPQTGYGIKPEMTEFIGKLIHNNRTIFTWFGNPYAIDRIKSLREADGLILAYQENEFTEDLSAQLIFGGIGARGSLPVTINEIWPYDFGIITPGNIRIKYGLPENAGMSSALLEKIIDTIVDIGLTAKAFPGCEVMIARKGMVVFSKTYGFHNYDNRINVDENDLYDLASVTKISATLAGLMLLDSEGKFSPDRTLGSYLPFYKNSNKENLPMSDILTHQAGLISWIPFWEESVKKNGEFKRNIFRYTSSEKYPLEVAQWLFINKNYRKKIFNEIKKTPLGEKKYLYSDLAFIIAPDIIEKLTGEKWYDFVTTNIYHKLGAYDICFNPRMKYPLSRIVPTEYDSLFRKQQLQGTVHDEGAAMLGGISGHAGLFATANDLMKLMEMYRRTGSYGGEQIISNEVLERYTRVQYPENDNRRGLGFDKPLLDNAESPPKEAYPCKDASPSSFGHSGYTGTFVWMDPEYEISYIFLSNRVNPTRNNNLLSELNIRSDILQAIYDSIIK
jgi:beta-N-acetylhexosaminidase